MDLEFAFMSFRSTHQTVQFLHGFFLSLKWFSIKRFSMKRLFSPHINGMRKQMNGCTSFMLCSYNLENMLHHEIRKIVTFHRTIAPTEIVYYVSCIDCTRLNNVCFKFLPLNSRACMWAVRLWHVFRPTAINAYINDYTLTQIDLV